MVQTYKSKKLTLVNNFSLDLLLTVIWSIWFFQEKSWHYWILKVSLVNIGSISSINKIQRTLLTAACQHMLR